MDTILLVEDDKLFRHMLKEFLESKGFLLLDASTGARMKEILQKHAVDLVLLDIRLPDGNGLDFIADVKSYTNAPIIMCSGDGDKQTIVSALKQGADDFLSKPPDFDILIERLNANLRRYKTTNDNGLCTEQSAVDTIIHFDKWYFDRKKMQMFDHDHNSCELTIREFYLLDTLICNIGFPVKRQDLCEAIKEENYIPTPRAIDVKITRIRKKIGDDASNPDIIKTVRGVGYMLCSSTKA